MNGESGILQYSLSEDTEFVVKGITFFWINLKISKKIFQNLRFFCLEQENRAISCQI